MLYNSPAIKMKTLKYRHSQRWFQGEMCKELVHVLEVDQMYASDSKN